MIKTIEINVVNGVFNKVAALINYPENICYYNNHKYHISDEVKEEMVRIIRLWKNEYGSSNVIDSDEFTVIVTTNIQEVFHGKGIFPQDYDRVLELLGELDDKSK